MNVPVNTLYEGNCLDLIKSLPDECLDAVVSDPPYGQGFSYDGDDTIDTAEELLYNYLRAIEPKLKRNAHVVIFWTMRNLDILIDAVRASGFTYRRTLSMYLPKGGARPYLGWLPRTQAIVVAQKYLPKQPSEFHAELAAYLSEAITNSGITKAELARQLKCDSRLIMKWTRIGDPAWCLPTPRFYKPMKELLSLDDTHDILLTREPATGQNARPDMIYRHDTYVVDNWNEEMLHLAQKPLSVLKHIVQCVTPEGGVVLDGFGGSGSTGVACAEMNRNYILAEVSPDFCKVIRQRLKL